MNKFFLFVKNNYIKIIKFCVTGGLGTVTNLLLFYFFADKLSFPDIPVNIGCFIIAGTQNYFINHLWTFKGQCGQKPSFKKWFTFMSSSIIGFLVNLGVYILLIRLAAWPYKVIPQAIGILSGMIVNYIFSNYFVFASSKTK